MKMTNYHGRPMDGYENFLFFSECFLVLLLLVLMLFYTGCYTETATVTSTKEKETEVYHSDRDKAIERYRFEIFSLDWRGIYLAKFDGHEYLKMGDHFMHSVSCPGLHDE